MKGCEHDWRLVVWGWRLELVDNLPTRRFIDLPMNSRPDCPLKIRGQVLPPGSTGVMIFWGRSQLRVFAPSWQIKVLPFRQVSDDDSCRRMNSAVMKIRLFKPKTPSNTEISITVEVFNSPANRCLKGNNLQNRRSPTCGQRRPCNLCLKGRTLAVVQMNIRTSKKEHWSIRWFIDLLMNSGWCRGYNISSLLS